MAKATPLNWVLDAMEQSVEINWFDAYYNLFAVWDSTVNFWLTATFAVIVAAHVLREASSKSLTRLLAFLYVGFSLYVFFRGISLFYETFFILDKLSEIGLESNAPLPFGEIGDVIICVLFLVGTAATTHFVLSSAKQKDGGI